MPPLSGSGGMPSDTRQNVQCVVKLAERAVCEVEKRADFTTMKQTKQNEAKRSKTNMILILFLILNLILYYHHPMIIVPTLTRRRR